MQPGLQVEIKRLAQKPTTFDMVLLDIASGGLPYLCQPIGSVASGFLITWLGRKRFLMLITLPYLLSCVLVSTAPSVSVLFVTNVVVGLTVGFTEAPLNSYFGEICQPELRSVLAGSACKFVLHPKLLKSTS
jgi:MFS family permease